jgi:hypothetical protein
MNYKYFIIFIYLGFVALILTMVFKSCSQNIDLESKNYYADELVFQTQIDALKMGYTYRDSFKVSVYNNELIISQPSSIECDSFELSFKKPDNALADKLYKFKGPTIQKLKQNEFDAGVYNLDILFHSNNQTYLVEKKIKI